MSAARLPRPREGRGDALGAALKRAGHSCARTSARSLSPRPERQTRSSSPSAGLASAQASACAVSSAGMIPSSRVTSPERRERLLVGDGDVAGAARCRAATRARADAGVVQPGRDRVRLDDLARRRPAAPPTSSRAGRRRAPPTVSGAPWRPVSSPSPAGLDPDQLDVGVVDEGGEDADRVGAAADAGDHARRAAGPRARAAARAPRRRSRAGGRARSPGRAPGRPPSR